MLSHATILRNDSESHILRNAEMAGEFTNTLKKPKKVTYCSAPREFLQPYRRLWYHQERRFHRQDPARCVDPDFFQTDS